MHEAPEAAAASAAPSGRQFLLRHGDTEAVVTEVGGGLRSLSIAGVPVVWGYPESAMASGGRGQLLAPWPNRLEDGTYSFGRRTGHAALDEPDRRNAIHGLVRWLPWRAIEHVEDRLVVACDLVPQPAYPWRLGLELTYEVGAGGLVVTAAAENRSHEPAPFGAGMHPYLDAGPLGADGCQLHLAAGRHLLLDDRGLPRGSEAVEGGPFDFRHGCPLAGVSLDDCFFGLEPPASAPEVGSPVAWQATLVRGDESRCRLWADEAWPYVMCYTGDTLAPADRRRGVAIEPMTCPPNALRTGDSLVTIGPGERWVGRFGIDAGV